MSVRHVYRDWQHFVRPVWIEVARLHPSIFYFQGVDVFLRNIAIGHFGFSGRGPQFGTWFSMDLQNSAVANFAWGGTYAESPNWLCYFES